MAPALAPKLPHMLPQPPSVAAIGANTFQKNVPQAPYVTQPTYRALAENFRNKTLIDPLDGGNTTTTPITVGFSTSGVGATLDTPSQSATLTRALAAWTGFSHVLDGGWVADHYCRSWQLLKLHNHGPIVNIDAAKPPYGSTRRFITNIDVNGNAGRAHTIVVPGGKDAMGQWVYDEVFKYLFTHPVDQSGPAVPMDADCEMNQQPKK